MNMRKRAFTLIELLVVIAIICYAILTALLFLRHAGGRQNEGLEPRASIIASNCNAGAAVCSVGQQRATT